MASKKLTLNAVKKENAKFNEKFTVPIKDGRYEIIVNKYFKKSDSAKLLSEYVSITEKLIESGAEIDITSNDIFLFPVLLIKYMTNVPLPDDGIELVAYIQELINAELLNEIIEALPKEEVDKVEKWISDSFENMPQVLESMKQQQDLELKLSQEVKEFGDSRKDK